MEIKRSLIQRGFCSLANSGLFNSLPDKLYLQLMYWARTGRRLNLKCPKSFNEKLQWLKLYNHRPEYCKMVDKYEAKKYVANIIGEQYIIPTLGVWDRFDDIDFSKLPNQFVLKCTHDSGGLIICKDKFKLDIKEAKTIIEKSLKTNYYFHGREWPYKNVKPRIIAEQYMVSESGEEIKDYKIFNFNGKPRLIQVDYDRFIKHKRNLYTTDWKYIEAELEFPTDVNVRIEKPDRLNEMLLFATKLSKDIPHVRTDFYFFNEKIYFGELTFFHGSGFEHFMPETLGVELGKYINLPIEDSV